MCNNLFNCCTNTKQDTAQCESEVNLPLYVCEHVVVCMFGLRGVVEVFYGFVCTHVCLRRRVWVCVLVGGVYGSVCSGGS